MSVVKPIVWSIAGIMAVSLSGAGLNMAFGQDVTLSVDGSTTTFSIVYGSVSEVLASHDIELNYRDKVTPDLGTPVTNDMMITVEYARPIDLTLDGQDGIYWTYATNVGSVINSLGLGQTALKLSASLDTEVPRDGMTLNVKTGHNVSVLADGQTQTIHSFGTVADTLTELGLTWTDDDIISPSLDTALSDGLAISIVRVAQQTVTRQSPIPYDTQNSDDPSAPAGKVTVVTPGVDGVMTQTVVQTTHDGTVVDETVASEDVTLPPVTQVTTTGSKPATPTPTPKASPPVSVTPGSAQAIAYDMVKARGWDDSQFQCLVSLWNHESGWNVSAQNRYSGAYGIPQALPGSKMASVGADWRTNPATQITWGLSYITGRYGTPCGAWSSFQAKGWY
ncbi:MAG: ubiquitin-like domain-containing protein [Propionibacteriaceae bacterium]|nr:ubiquitin-like domain-containing protein [Propionibacteriaceae bacterium]